MLFYGLILTATSEADAMPTLPGLPLEILRQSSLGGGLVELVLGNGVLSVPASSSEAAQALATTMITLHPLAVAGFVSLFVNALALVPIGSKHSPTMYFACSKSSQHCVTLTLNASPSHFFYRNRRREDFDGDIR